MLPAVRKKSNERRFPAKSSYKGGSAGFATHRRSWDRLCRGWYALWRWCELAGAARWRREKQRRRKEKNGDGTSFKGQPGSKRKPRRGLLRASTKPKTATSAPRNQKKIADGDSCPMVLFPLITKLPLDLKPKLLPNLYSNSKISKNKSCSKFKVLQLCFYNHPLIRSTFWNASLNSKREYLKNHAFSNYFNFYKTTLKTPKTNFVQLDKLYIFALRLNPKMYFDFELGFLG